MAITKASSSLWEGRADAERLQRVYGISFPDSKQLKQWRHLQEEAAKRDHRKLGRDQELFMFNPMSPGTVSDFDLIGGLGIELIILII
jgi:threonyl-tRNA synthetase